MQLLTQTLCAGGEVGRPGHTPATSSSAADREVDVVNLSSGNPDHGHSSCAGGLCHKIYSQSSSQSAGLLVTVPTSKRCSALFVHVQNDAAN